MIYVDCLGHMITDGDIEELHSFAQKIGLKREWFQNKKSGRHYDLTTERKRNQAIRAGAIFVHPKSIVTILNAQMMEVE